MIPKLFLMPVFMCVCVFKMCMITSLELPQLFAGGDQLFAKRREPGKCLC